MSKIINLETFFVPDEEKYDLLKSEIGQASTVVGLMLNDGFLHETPGAVIDKLTEEYDLYLVPGMVCDNIEYAKVIPFDFNMHVTFNSYKGKSTHKWNSAATNFLFLGGVPTRPNRVGLLNRFNKAGLLKTAQWSFFKPWTAQQETWCRQYLKDDYDQVMLLERQVDSVYDSSKYYGTAPAPNEFAKDPCWIDPAVYQNTVLSVIAEGIDVSDLSSRFLTEKTFRTFVQRHPFLHASRPEMFDYIKELGFKTFEEYMLIKDYAYLPSEEDRLDAIVENTKHFLSNYKQHQDSIDNDIEYNYQLFFKLADVNEQIPKQIGQQFSISDEELNKWFYKKGFAHLVRAYGN